MNWILITYLIALIFLATKLEDTSKRLSFRPTWIAFALIPLWQFLMHLFRAGNIRDVRELALIQVWDQAGTSLLLGISFLYLLRVIAPVNSIK